MGWFFRLQQDLIFKALADPSRRTLLDQLNRQDGQSLSELEAYLEMSRFGVMKHLRLLEEAGLITTEKVGREKHHFLNPVPIQLVYDRWVRKYAQPVTTKLTDLKYQLEQTDERYSDPPRKIVQTFHARWEPEAVAVGESKVTWLIEPEGAVCKLTLIHEELPNVPYVEGFLDGWSRIMSSLKTVLETGEMLTYG